MLASHPWSDMVFDDMCPMGLSQGISSPLCTTSSSSSSSSTRSSFTSSSSTSSSPLSPTFQTSTGDFRLNISHSRIPSSTPSPVDPCTHEYNILDTLTATKKDNNEPSLPQSIAPKCLDGAFQPRHDSLLDVSMSLDDFDLTNGFEQRFGDHHGHQDKSDQDMDVDSDGSIGNDNDDTSSKSSPFLRDSSTICDVTGPLKLSRSPEPKERTSKSNEKASPSKTKSKSKSKAKSTKTKFTPSSTSTSTSTLRRPAKAARKQSGTEQLSPEAKRQRFLERSRLAAAKCGEKKRLQTLKTITDADEITAKYQALHESLNELQEEVRMLKNQILCHRDCGCDVIQKVIKTSLTAPSSSSLSRKMSMGNPLFILALIIMINPITNRKSKAQFKMNNPLPWRWDARHLTRRASDVLESSAAYILPFGLLHALL